MGPAKGKNCYSVPRNAAGLFLKPEHIEIAEKALGKSLPAGAVVHHHDKNRGNNANTNLVICQSQQYHLILHSRMNSIADGVDPNTHKRCYTCKLVKPYGEYYRDSSNWYGYMKQCKACASERQRKRSRKRKTDDSVSVIASEPNAEWLENETRHVVEPELNESALATEDSL